MLTVGSPPNRGKISSDKRGKNAEVVIHDEQIIKPKERIPKGSRFKGYRDLIIQDLVIQARNTCYRLARWLTPQGEFLNNSFSNAARVVRFLLQRDYLELSDPSAERLAGICRSLLIGALTLLGVALVTMILYWGTLQAAR